MQASETRSIPLQSLSSVSMPRASLALHLVWLNHVLDRTLPANSWHITNTMQLILSATSRGDRKATVAVSPYTGARGSCSTFQTTVSWGFLHLSAEDD